MRKVNPFGIPSPNDDSHSNEGGLGPQPKLNKMDSVAMFKQEE